jgi:hypothetical protein
MGVVLARRSMELKASLLQCDCLVVCVRHVVRMRQDLNLKPRLEEVRSWYNTAAT